MEFKHAVNAFLNVVNKYLSFFTAISDKKHVLMVWGSSPSPQARTVWMRECLVVALLQTPESSTVLYAVNRNLKKFFAWQQWEVYVGPYVTETFHIEWFKVLYCCIVKPSFVQRIYSLLWTITSLMKRLPNDRSQEDWIESPLVIGTLRPFCLCVAVKEDWRVCVLWQSCCARLDVSAHCQNFSE